MLSIIKNIINMPGITPRRAVNASVTSVSSMLLLVYSTCTAGCVGLCVCTYTDTLLKSSNKHAEIEK